MSRIRTIKPEFFTSEDIFGMTPLARLFYVSLWCESDREGRLEWKLGTFKARYLPGDDCDISALGDELISRGLIELYEVDGKKYAFIPTFTEHQVINNREAPSKIPARVRTRASTRESGVEAEGKERKEGKENTGVDVDPAGSDDPADLPNPKAALMPSREDAPASDDPAVALAVALRKLGVEAFFTHPPVQDWTRREIPMTVFHEAVLLAREQKGDAKIAINYLATIVENLLRPPKGKANGAAHSGPMPKDWL